MSKNTIIVLDILCYLTTLYRLQNYVASIRERKVKLSLQQAMEAHGDVRRRESHIF
jgi:hypothetical protein